MQQQMEGIVDRVLGSDDQSKMNDVVQDLHFGTLAEAMPEDMQKYIQQKIIQKSRKEVEDKWNSFTVDVNGIIRGHYFRWDLPMLDRNLYASRMRDLDNGFEVEVGGIHYTCWRAKLQENGMVYIWTYNTAVMQHHQYSNHFWITRDLFSRILLTGCKYCVRE